MKILKFNEKYGPTDKIIRITFGEDILVPVKEIENTEAYRNNLYRTDLKNYEEKREHALYYGVEEWLQNADIANNYSYQLCDGLGNPIENEELFDKTINYNL